MSQTRRVTALIFCVIFSISLILIFSSCGTKKEADIVLGTFTVDTGDYDRIDTPVRYVCLSKEIFGDPKKFQREGSFAYIDEGAGLALLRDHNLVLIGKNGGRTDVQWESEIDFNWEAAGRKGALNWILKGTIPKETKQSYKLVLEKSSPKSGVFKVEHIDNKNLLIKKEEKSVLRYNYGIVRQEEGKKGHYDRAAFIHPLWTPGGKIITAGFPKEHINQNGLFLAWVQAKFGGVDGDFGSMGDKPARMLPDQYGPSIIRGPVFTELALFNKGVIKGKIYLREINTVKVYNTASADLWMFDLYYKQAPVNPDEPTKLPVEVTGATPKPWEKPRVAEKPPRNTVPSMTLEQYHNGGIAFRGIDEWSGDNIAPDVLTSGGKDRASGDGTPARWIDYTGALGDEWGGLAVFDHPRNKRYPTPLRINERYSYFCYAFTKDKPYTVYMDEPLELIYRIVIHNGHPDKELNERIANDFASPPKIRWNAKN